MSSTVALLASIAFAVICASIARSKNRRVRLWAILGLFFGVFALVWLLCLRRSQPAVGGYGPAGFNRSGYDQRPLGPYGYHRDPQPQSSWADEQPAGQWPPPEPAPRAWPDAPAQDPDDPGQWPPQS